MNVPINIAQLGALNPQPTTELGKLEDAGIVVPQGRIDRKWGEIQPKDWTGKKLDVSKYKNSFATNSDKFIEHFGLRSVEFGNWMSQEDRMNFLFNTAISLQDLADVLKIQPHEIGLQQNISIALGARGNGGPALAHYESLTYAVINLTKTGGAFGVLAHEYGHALDNLISLAVNGNIQESYLTGDTTAKNYFEERAKKGQFHKWFEDFFHALYFDKEGNKSAFYQQMVKINSDYWERRVEVWARYFEMFVSYLLKENQKRNSFLAQPYAAYTAEMPYPSTVDFQRALPYAKNIISTGIKLLLDKGEVRAYGVDKKSLSETQKRVLSLDEVKNPNQVKEKPRAEKGKFVLIDNISGEPILLKKTLKELVEEAEKLEYNKGMKPTKLIIYEVEYPNGRPKATKRVPQNEVDKYLNKPKSTGFQAPKKNADFQRLPVNDILTRSDFQNRKEDYSKETFDRIVESAKANEFQWSLLDPIVVWENNGNYVVISGHSRRAAFEYLFNELGLEDFRTIPAKIFRGSEKEARNLALNSNTLATKETDSERANYYRELRKSGKSEREIQSLAKRNEGANASRVLAYSYLNATGKAFLALKAFEKAEDTSRNNILNVANWLGKARQKYNELSNSHENELFDWLINGGYGTKKGQVSNFNDFDKLLYGLIQKNTVFGKFEADKPLNVNRSIYLTPIEQEHENKKAAAKKELQEASKKRDDKRKELIQRGASQEDFIRVLQPYDNEVYFAQQKLKDLMKKDVEVYEGAKDQTTLFGLGAVEILSQNSKINNNGYFPTYTQLDDYSHLIGIPGLDGMVIKNTDLDSTLEEIKTIIAEHKGEVQSLAQHLKADTIEQTAFNVWHFIKHNIVYDFDLPGVEEIRTPAQTWADRDHRADCEDMAIFTAAIFENLNIPYQLTVVAFNGAKQYGHIYITAFARNGKEVVVDGVMHTFNQHPDNITKVLNIEMLKTKKQMALSEIKGLGATAAPDAVTQKLMRQQSAILQQLKNKSISKQQRNYLRAELRKVRYIIMLNGTEERDEILPLMSALLDVRPNGKFVFASNAKMERVYWYLQKIKEGYKPQEIEEMLGAGLNGWIQDRIDDAKDFVDDSVDTVKKASFKSVGEFVSRNLKSAWEDIKNGGQAVIDGIKVGLTKYNPALIAARNAFLGMLKLNVGNMAGRWAYGYVSESDAKQRGYNMNAWSEAVNNIGKAENTWEKLGGELSSLKRSVEVGAKKKGIELSGLNGLGSTGAEIAAVAAPVLAAILPILLKNKPDEIEGAISVNPETGQIEVDQEKLKKIAIDYGTEKGKEFIQDQINQSNSSSGSTSPNTPQQDGYSSEEERQRANDEFSKDDNNNQAGFGGSWVGWLIPGSILLGGLYYWNKKDSE